MRPGGEMANLVRMKGYALLLSGKDRHWPRLLRAPDLGTTAFRYDLERMLHDKVAVGMSAVAAQLDLVSADSVDPAVDAKIHAVRDTLCQIVDDVRDVGKSIYPPMLSGVGVEPLLRSIADNKGLRLRLDLSSRELNAEAQARVGLLVADHLNTLASGTIVHIRVRGRRLVRVQITEHTSRRSPRRRPLRAMVLCG